MPILGRDPLPAIVSFAREDVRVRGLILNGSRARADAELDVLSDTVALVVDDLEAFVADQSLWRTCALFRRAACAIAERLGYEYPHDMDEQVTHYLKEVGSRGP